jgi:hypothetical protein
VEVENTVECQQSSDDAWIGCTHSPG